MELMSLKLRIEAGWTEKCSWAWTHPALEKPSDNSFLCYSEAERYWREKADVEGRLNYGIRAGITPADEDRAAASETIQRLCCGVTYATTLTTKNCGGQVKESDIQKAILDYLAAKRIFAFRLNTAGIKLPGRFLRAHSLGAGAADILAFVSNGGTFRGPGFTPLWIEVKNETGKQPAEQKSFQRHVEWLGHQYILARSVDDVRELWEMRGEKQA